MKTIKEYHLAPCDILKFFFVSLHSKKRSSFMDLIHVIAVVALVVIGVFIFKNKSNG